MVRAKWFLILLALFIVFIGPVGCQAKVAENVAPPAQSAQPPMEGERGAAPAAPDSYAGGTSASAQNATDRMIIRTVSMTMVVENTDKVLADLRALAQGQQGYIAESNRWLVNDQPYARITVRVPAGSLDQALDAIRGMAIKVENESNTGQDVTEQYTDVQSQLRNLEATEKELLALLTEVRENGGKAEDILAVHQRLTEIRGQIEQLKGRSQYLERMTALATITIEVRPKEAPRPVGQEVGWNPLVTITNALRAFVSVLQVVGQILIYLAIFSPFVLVPVLILWLLVRAVRRRNQRRRATPPTT